MRWNIECKPPGRARLTVTALALVVLLWPAAAAAQFRYPGRFPNSYGYRFAEPESDLRLAVTPREAMVYVDGYLAGAVDDFDGIFQRLHVTPGEHELTIYLQGYRTIRQRLYLSPNARRTITQTMEKVGPGEATEPPPEPPPAADRTPPPRNRFPFPARGGQRPRDPRQPDQGPPLPPAESPVRAGSIVLRVQPADADVLIDGEQWRGPSGDERLVVQVSEGRHRVEVFKEGYVPFSTDVEVGRGVSLPINVTLLREKQ